MLTLAQMTKRRRAKRPERGFVRFDHSVCEGDVSRCDFETCIVAELRISFSLYRSRDRRSGMWSRPWISGAVHRTLNLEPSCRFVLLPSLFRLPELRAREVEQDFFLDDGRKRHSNRFNKVWHYQETQVSIPVHSFAL